MLCFGIKAFKSEETLSRKCIAFQEILATAYIWHEPWEMGVHKRNGVVYLDIHKLPERPQSEFERRRPEYKQEWVKYEVFRREVCCRGGDELPQTNAVGV